MTPHPAARPRRTAFGRPPAIDMCAPRLSGAASAASLRRGPPELLHLGEDLRGIGQLAPIVALDERTTPCRSITKVARWHALNSGEWIP